MTADKRTVPEAPKPSKVMAVVNAAVKVYTIGGPEAAEEFKTAIEAYLNDR